MDALRWRAQAGAKWLAIEWARMEPHLEAPWSQPPVEGSPLKACRSPAEVADFLGQRAASERPRLLPEAILSSAALAVVGLELVWIPGPALPH